MATVAHYGVLYLCLEVLGAGSAALSNLAASIIGIAVSFAGNRRFVFSDRSEPLIRQAARFSGLYALIASLHGSVLLVWTDWLGLHYNAGFLIAMSLQVVLGFWGNKRYVFNRARRPAKPTEAGMSEFEYSGDELGLFAASKNWKTYWSGQVAPFVGDRVLDVGAGIGTTARTLNFKRYEKWVGLEPDRKLCEAIVQARARGLVPDHLDVRHGTTGDLLPGETFDTVLYIDVLEHIENHAAELRRAARHLSRDGHIVIVVPAHDCLYTAFDRRIGHFRRYDKKLLASIVPDGMDVKKMRYLDSAGITASLANRLLLNSDAPTAAQIRFWDSVLVRISRLTDRLIRYKLGKSLVCVLGKVAARAEE